MEFTSDLDVQLVRSSASDADVVFAARVSTQGEQILSHPGEGTHLINYLMRDRHGTPFEHNSMTFLVTAPIFVFREFHRHRVGWSYNEESARYRRMEPKFYIPGPDRNLVQQGRAGAYHFEPGTPGQHQLLSDTMRVAYREAYESYEVMLADGIAREVARSVLPVGLFSSMYATCNARSLMHFLSLRTKDDRAKVPSFPQREIEMVAQKMESFWADLMPTSHDCFIRHGRVAP